MGTLLFLYVFVGVMFAADTGKWRTMLTWPYEMWIDLRNKNPQPMEW